MVFLPAPGQHRISVMGLEFAEPYFRSPLSGGLEIVMEQPKIKCQLHAVESVAGDGIDRIGLLSNSLIFHILSFHEMRDSMRTTVLSSRWKSLWTLVPNFDFYFSVHHNDQETRIIVLLNRSVSTLELLNVVSMDERSLQRLHLGCPVLEDLTIKPSLNNIRKLEISLPSLKCLEIINGHFALSLANIEVGNPDDVSLPVWNDNEDYGEHLCALMEGLSGVEILKISGGTWEVEEKVLDSHSPVIFKPGSRRLLVLPMFHNLVSLSLGVEDCHKPEGWYVHGEILENSHNLEELNFYNGLFAHDNPEPDFARKWKRPRCIPHCLCWNLNKINIGDFLGREKEMLLAGYFLKLSKVLEKMTINCTLWAPSCKKKQRMMKLQDNMLKFSTAQKSCKCAHVHGIFKVNRGTLKMACLTSQFSSVVRLERAHVYGIFKVNRVTFKMACPTSPSSSVERKALNLVVVGSSPTVGEFTPLSGIKS
ncbi:FBD domain [Dillenia turbinata]|uniref:FBD domain n=1 Tax=Dillenia turbinata TaxID=194707 RepID=A0AAN8VMH7_9MAGN